MADIRQLMEEAFDEIALDESESVKDFIREAFAIEKSREVWVAITCKHCERSGKYVTQVKIPDFKERSRAIDLLLNQAKGKPKETVKVSVEIGMKALQEMSLDDLEAEERAILQAHPELVER